MHEGLLFTHTPMEDTGRARITIDTDTRSDTPVKETLYGKFCEHLGRNIYGGMDAEILTNPSFGSWRFPADRHRIDGGRAFEQDPDRIRSRIESYVADRGWPDATALIEARAAGAAFPWLPLGPDEAVSLSPDTDRTGDRAQRVETAGESGRPEGVFQWTHLPLHRTCEFEFRVAARAVDPASLGLTVRRLDGAKPESVLARSHLEIGTEWSTVDGMISISDSTTVDADGCFAVCLESEEATNVVLDRLLLYPNDHVHAADPDVIEHLREAELPLLRWPGGNFASGYRWRDGVGPPEDRPTRPNPAWGGVEDHRFGTDEFMQFCDAVGCAPMICVNAGNGTPEEAASWVEYCNGSTGTEFGALRAEHGTPDPYEVTHWEVGNELYGEWQVHWTTPRGYADRFERFRDAMTAVDPSITVHACGNRARSEEWNDRLLAGVGDAVRSITDHVLTGGIVGPETDPDELFHAFLGFADQLGVEYRQLRSRMRDAGIEEPRLAITELQLFADFRGDPDGTASLTPETMPTPHTISEALYDATIIHECIRMGEFASLLTHSATVNHGGGLRKEQERTRPDPCHHGHTMGADLIGTTPVAVDVACGTISTERTFGEIAPVDAVPALDAMACLAPDEEELLLMLVHRSSDTGPIEVSIDPGSFPAAPEASLTRLAGDSMHARNTLETSNRIHPETETVALDGGSLRTTLPPYSLTRVSLPRV